MYVAVRGTKCAIATAVYTQRRGLTQTCITHLTIDATRSLISTPSSAPHMWGGAVVLTSLVHYDCPVFESSLIFACRDAPSSNLHQLVEHVEA